MPPKKKRGNPNPSGRRPKSSEDQASLSQEQINHPKADR